MNNFQRYPYADYLVDRWLNHVELSRIEINYILLRVREFEKNNQQKNEDLSDAYAFTVKHFPLTTNMQNVEPFIHPLREQYLKSQLKMPPSMMRHQERTYEFIKWNRQLREWVFNLEHQLALTEIVTIILKYPDVNGMDLQLTKADFITRKINAKGRVDLNRLKELAEAMLETTKSNPPMIRRPKSHSEEKILKQIEEITEEVKKTKRLTFKSAEEIKQSLSQITSGTVEEVEENIDRELYVTTILEIYDVLFYLARMLQKNEPGQLASEVMNQLIHVEGILQSIDIEVIPTIGKMLDPEVMEGVGTVPKSQFSQLSEYHVADEILRGFTDRRDNKLIREAKVITVLN